MPIEILPYEPDHAAAVRAFNGRLHAGGVAFTFPESSVPTWLPPASNVNVYQELFLAVEGQAVRGGYILKHQDFVVRGQVISVGAFQLPLSEGTIDRAYAWIGVQLLRDALRRQPLLYTLGIGGYEEAAARLLLAARFHVEKVPFHFRVGHGAAFLREIQPLRARRALRWLCDLGAATGLGAVGISLVHRIRTASWKGPPVEIADLTSFHRGVDSVWQQSAGVADMAAVRDYPVLARLYDAPGNRFIRVAVTEGGQMRGWAVLLSSAHHRDKYFGNMKVGSLVDLLAAPGYERPVLDAAVARLQREAVDIIVTNQSLGAVCAALRGAGFLEGPSNFLFAASPRLVSAIGPLEPRLTNLHFNRGDGDGPIHL